MTKSRTIIAYKHYFADFLNSINQAEAKKIAYILDMLKTQQRVSEKFVKAVRDGLYELRVEYSGNIVILSNGFQKKTQRTPVSEINKALKLKEEYYGTKRNK